MPSQTFCAAFSAPLATAGDVRDRTGSYYSICAGDRSSPVAHPFRKHGMGSVTVLVCGARAYRQRDGRRPNNSGVGGREPVVSVAVHTYSDFLAAYDTPSKSREFYR